MGFDDEIGDGSGGNDDLTSKQLDDKHGDLAAKLLKDYLDKLYGKDGRDDLAKYLQFRKDLLKNKQGREGQLLMDDAELQKKLRDLQRQKFEEYLKNRRKGLTKEELNKLKEKESQILGHIEEEPV